MRDEDSGPVAESQPADESLSLFPPQAPSADDPLHPEESVNPALWPIYLFFKPRTFFVHFVLTAVPGLTVLAAWAYGVAGAIDELDSKADRPGMDQFFQSWQGYWITVVAVGIFGGAMYWLFGGWWYNVRLRYCGVRRGPLEAMLGRRVYLYAAQTLALPTIGLAIYETVAYPTPLAATEGVDDYWVYLLFLIFPFWSIWTSYVGATTCFELKRAKAILWFVILPGIFYGLIVGFVVAAMSMPYFNMYEAADLASPRVYTGRTMSFHYPGNWIPEAADSFTPADEEYAGFEPPQDAYLGFDVYAMDGTPTELFEALCEEFKQTMPDMQPHGPLLTRWGPIEGTGRVFRGTIEGEPYELQLIVSPRPGERAMVAHVFCHVDQLDLFNEGIKLIHRTWVWR